jgi:hypothetical protein
MKNAIFILFYTVKLGFIGVLVALFFLEGSACSSLSCCLVMTDELVEVGNVEVRQHGHTLLGEINHDFRPYLM